MDEAIAFALSISVNWPTLLPEMRDSHRHPNTFHVFPSRAGYFKISFLPYVIMNGMNLV